MKTNEIHQFTAARRLLSGLPGIMRGACLFFAALASLSLRAQTPSPTPVPPWFIEWTGAEDSNMLNMNNWILSGTSTAPAGHPSTINGPAAALYLPLVAENKTLNYEYNGAGTERFTFFSIHTGANKAYHLNFSGNENGWLEINPIAKGFAANRHLADGINPQANDSSARLSMYVTLGSYTRLVLDDSYLSMNRAPNGLGLATFTLLGNAEMDVSKNGEAGMFIQANGAGYTGGQTLEIGGILKAEQGTRIYMGTQRTNINSTISTGETARWEGLIEWDTTTIDPDDPEGRILTVTKAQYHHIYGSGAVVSGTVISPAVFRIRGGSAQYIVDGRHDGPIRTGHTDFKSAAALGGRGVVNGDVEVLKGSMITPAEKGTATGPGEKLTINGNVTLNGILSFDLVTTDEVDRLEITGNLTIPASTPDIVPTLAVGRAETFPLAPGTYELLTVNGTVTGAFEEANVSLPLSLSLRPSWRWVGNTLEVSFEQLPFASDPELTGMYRVVAERIDQISNAGIVDPILFDTLNRQPSSILFKDVLYQLSPSTYQAWYPGAVFRTNSMVQNIEDAQFQDAAYKRKKGTWQTTLQGYRQEASRDRNEMATYSNYGTIASIAGADYAFGENFVAGGFIAYERGDFDLDTEGGESNTDSYTFGVKARYTTGKFHFNATAFYGADDYESRRTVTSTNLATWADADTSGTRLGAALSAAWTYNHPWFEITPTAGVQWLSWQVDSFQERNADEAGLFVYKQKETAFQGKVGIRVARSVKTKYGHIRPFFHYALIHEFDNGTRTLSADLFGGRIDIDAPGSHSPGYRLDFGLDFDIGRSVRVDLRYLSEYKTAVDESRGLRAGVTWTF